MGSRHRACARLLAASLLGAVAAVYGVEGERSGDEPSPDDLARWVRELGSDQFAVREEATEKLKAHGRRCREALQEAARSEDPEVRHRASLILSSLARGQAAREKPSAQARLGAETVLSASVQGQSVSIQEGPSGIRLEVQERKDGETATQVYEAKDRAEFKEKYPEIYEQYLAAEEGFELGGLRLFWEGFRDEGEEGEWKLGDGLRQEQERMQQILLERLREVEKTLRGRDRTVEKALRFQGGPRLRLGVTMAPVPELLARHLQLDGGVLVEGVAEGSPAERAGLDRCDIITKFNGSPVKSPENLAALVREAPEEKGLALEILRDGKPVSLEVALRSPEKPR